MPWNKTWKKRSCLAKNANSRPSSKKIQKSFFEIKTVDCILLIFTWPKNSSSFKTKEISILLFFSIFSVVGVFTQKSFDWFLLTTNHFLRLSVARFSQFKSWKRVCLRTFQKSKPSTCCGFWVWKTWKRWSLWFEVSTKATATAIILSFDNKK